MDIERHHPHTLIRLTDEEARAIMRALSVSPLGNQRIPQALRWGLIDYVGLADLVDPLPLEQRK